MAMEKLMERKRTEQQGERDHLLDILYFYWTSSTHHLAHQGNNHQENTNLDFLPSAILTSPYQCKRGSNRSYHQEPHTGARRRGHKAQSVSDNGAEGAWPASSRVSVQVGDKELKGGEGLREEETAGTCATSCRSEFSAWA